MPAPGFTAAIDALSNGRFELGVGIGARDQDYAALGCEHAGRGRRFERQLRRIDELWRRAIEHGEQSGVMGPMPVQRPRPPIRVRIESLLRPGTSIPTLAPGAEGRFVQDLAWVLEALVDGHVPNEIVVPDRVKASARIALDRMLSLPGVR